MKNGISHGEVDIDNALSFFLLSSQKIFADLQAAGFPVVETSTLTEEGVMQVKTEVSASCFPLGPLSSEESVWGKEALSASIVGREPSRRPGRRACAQH